MTATGRTHGHQVVWDEGGEVWRWLDNGGVVTDERPCLFCGEPFTEMCDECDYGTPHDPCLGHIDGALSACCGHGVEHGRIVFGDETEVRLPKLRKETT